MDENTQLNHVALQYHDKKQAETFFQDILGLKPSKNFSISTDLSNKIFGITENVEVFVYQNENTAFEVFITRQTKPSRGYDHFCIMVDNREEFINRCRRHGIEPNIVDKNGKKLVFIKDFSNNLFEVKEKQ